MTSRTMPSKLNIWFTRFSTHAAGIVGSPWTFVASVAIVFGWLVLGPALGYSNSWQLIINTVTNVVTFIVVFLIQNSQNRDSTAMNLKLDELIRAIQSARNEMIDIEKLSDAELEQLSKQYERFKSAWTQRHGRRN
jgi:low affinity Fe/Cu permease